MNILSISLAAGASMFFMTAASAAPLSAGASIAPESNIQNVRMVCNENGRSWCERWYRHRPLLTSPGTPRPPAYDVKDCARPISFGRAHDFRGAIKKRTAMIICNSILRM